MDMDIYICTYIDMYIYVHVYIYMYIYIYKYVCTYIYMDMDICTCKPVYIQRSNRRVRMSARAHKCTYLNSHIYIYT